MSVSLKVSLDAVAPKEKLAKLKKTLETPGMDGSLPESLLRMMRGHIKDNYVPTDDPGITFWSDVAQSAEAEAVGDTVTVSLYELGVGLRYRGSADLPGGGVTPGKSISSYTGKLTRALAIPNERTPIIQGRYVAPGRREIVGLLAFVRSVTRGDTVGYLVEGEQKAITRGKNKGGTRIAPKKGGSLLYTLKKITRHKPDPGILPPEEKVRATAVETLQAILEGL